MKKLTGRNVLIVFARQNFRDEEVEAPRSALADAGATVTLASSSLEEATGMLGAKLKADILLKDAKAGDYDMVVFTGGSGATEYFDSPDAHALAKAAMEQDKIVGAVCIAPTILANARLLEGRQVTCFPSQADHLKAKGAHYTGGSVTVDGKLITAEGPKAAQAIADALVKALAE